MDWFLGRARKGEVWREGRKLLDRNLRPGVVTSYRQMIQENTRVFLTRLLAAPKEFCSHNELSAVSLPHTALSLTVMQASGEPCHVPHIWVRPEGG